jgi:hypothetical protein
LRRANSICCGSGSQEIAVGELSQKPVVERTLVLEFERADGVGDVLQRVLDRVREGVHRVQAPGVAGVVVRRLADAVDGRVAQVDVARRHVDLGAQDVRAVGEFAGLHSAEEGEVFLGRAVAVGAGLAGFGQRAAVGAHLLRALRIDIGLAVADQGLGEVVHPLEVVRGVVEVLVPVPAQPPHRIDDGIDVLLLFLLRVGVVEAQVAGAAVVARQAEVQADRLGVAEMQVAVGLGREAGADFRRVHSADYLLRGRAGLPGPGAPGIPAGGKVGIDDVADEIRGLFGVGHDGEGLCGKAAILPAA